MKTKTSEKPENSTPDQEIDPQAVELYNLIEIMRVVDLNAPEAEINATTVSDGNGGRILL